MESKLYVTLESLLFCINHIERETIKLNPNNNSYLYTYDEDGEWIDCKTLKKLIHSLWLSAKNHDSIYPRSEMLLRHEHLTHFIEEIKKVSDKNSKEYRLKHGNYIRYDDLQCLFDNFYNNKILGGAMKIESIELEINVYAIIEEIEYEGECISGIFSTELKAYQVMSEFSNSDSKFKVVEYKINSLSID